MVNVKLAWVLPFFFVAGIAATILSSIVSKVYFAKPVSWWAVSSGVRLEYSVSLVASSITSDQVRSANLLDRPKDLSSRR